MQTQNEKTSFPIFLFWIMAGMENRVNGYPTFPLVKSVNNNKGENFNNSFPKVSFAFLV
jgi:hypothetical protein